MVLRLQLSVGVALLTVNGSRRNARVRSQAHASHRRARSAPRERSSGGCAMSESSHRSEHITAGRQDHAGAEALGRALLDRMDLLPGWPLPRFDLFVLGLAYFFVFYDITDIGFGMPAIVKQFHLSDNDVKFVAIAIGLIGYIVGSNLVGALAHRRGRRLAFLASLLVSGL